MCCFKYFQAYKILQKFQFFVLIIIWWLVDKPVKIFGQFKYGKTKLELILLETPVASGHPGYYYF